MRTGSGRLAFLLLFLVFSLCVVTAVDHAAAVVRFGDSTIIIAKTLVISNNYIHYM